MPPEQAAGKSVTTAADIYALGAILYELIVGRPPYQGDTTVQVVMQVVEGPPAPPHKINPAVDPDLELICLKAMEREPSERYSSAQAMASDLESWMAGDSISVRPPSFQAKISGWLKRNQSLAYGVFAAVFGFMICAPAVLTFFSGTLGQVYDEFPGTDRPWMFKIWVPNLISLLFAVVLFLFVWPSIGFLNAVISKPPTFLRSTISGFRISAFLSLIFYFLVGWLITIQGVHNYSSSNLNTMTNALWPSAESTAGEAVEKANNLFGGLEHIPETDRAKVVARRLEADRYASLPFSFGVLTLVVAGFAGPIIYGTMIASSLRRRNLPTWLLLLRYLIAWCATTILAIALIGLTYTFLISSSGGEMQSSMNSTMLTIGVLILLVYLVMRRWKKSPAEPSVA